MEFVQIGLEDAKQQHQVTQTDLNTAWGQLKNTADELGATHAENLRLANKLAAAEELTKNQSVPSIANPRPPPKELKPILDQHWSTHKNL